MLLKITYVGKEDVCYCLYGQYVPFLHQLHNLLSIISYDPLVFILVFLTWKENVYVYTIRRGHFINLQGMSIVSSKSFNRLHCYQPTHIKLIFKRLNNICSTRNHYQTFNCHCLNTIFVDLNKIVSDQLWIMFQIINYLVFNQFVLSVFNILVLRINGVLKCVIIIYLKSLLLFEVLMNLSV